MIERHKPTLLIMDEKDIKFIAKRYRSGRFSTKEGWKKLGIRPVSVWVKYRVAAAITAAVVLTASATIISKANMAPGEGTKTEVVSPATHGENIVRVIDFENAPLPVVVDKISRTYDAEITGLPESPDDYKLSLHYEGTASDLVETINEILGTEMTVTQR